MIVLFPVRLRVDNISDRVDRLCEPFVVDVDGELVTVPAGFVTDYASVPRVPFVFELLGDLGKWAAVAHDYLYGSVCAPALRLHGRGWADRVLYCGLIARGISSWKAWLMWSAVRSAGWAFYQPLAFKAPAAEPALAGSAAAGAFVPVGTEVKT